MLQYPSKNLLERLIIGTIILIMAIANFWHVIWYFFNRPPDTIFIGITHYYEDYFYYISLVKEGMQGNWLTRNLYTTEAIPPAPLWLLNIAIGKLGGLFGLAPWTSYDLAVFTLSILWLLISYWVIRKLIPESSLLRISAFLIATTASPYYLLQENQNGQLFVNPYLYFYNYTSAFNRLGGVAHLILQNILSLLAIFVAGRLIQGIYFRTMYQKQLIKKTFLLAVLLTTLLFINPSYVLVDVLAVGITAAFYFLIKPGIRPLQQFMFVAVIQGGLLGVSFLIIDKAFSHPFYQYFRVIENEVQPTIPDIFFHSMGVIIIPILLGLIPYLQKKDPIRILGAVYATIPIVLYFSDIPANLGLPYFRLHQPPAYVFFGIAAAYGLWLVARVLGNILPGKPREAFVAILTGAFVIFHLPILHYELKGRLESFWLPSWMNYMDKETFAGYEYLDTRPDGKVVLAFNNLEALVPALTGHPVYVGHRTLTYDYARKISEAYQFFNGQFSAVHGTMFLANNNIGYVVWRKSDGPAVIERQYPVLTKVFENDELLIWTPAPPREGR